MDNYSEQILIKLQNIFRLIFDDNELHINYKSNAEDIDEWDSLNQIKIILECEKEFAVTLNPRIINNFLNVGEMVEYLKANNAKI